MIFNTSSLASWKKALVGAACLAAAGMMLMPCAALGAEGAARAAKLAKRTPAGKTMRELVAEAVEAFHAGDTALAASMVEQLRKKPEFTAVRPPLDLMLAVGDYHFAQGTRDEQDTALDIYNQILDGETVSGRAAVMSRRAEIYARQGRYEQARAELTAIRRMSQSRRAQLLADLGDANVQLLQGQPEAARDRLLPLINVEDQSLAPMALFALGRAYIQLKQGEEAVACFRKLWGRYGQNESVKRAIFLAAQVYMDRGDFLEARKLYEACSVVGASLQTRVRPGADLIVKVTDPDHYARTRSQQLAVTLSVPSGDRETITLEKTRLNDELYVGHIATALALPAIDDGVLQIAGGDVIQLSYAGKIAPQKIEVVDDGMIRADSLPVPPPPPRRQPGATRPAKPVIPPEEKEEKDEPEILLQSRQISGTLNPGGSLYVQLVDADFDLTDKPDVAVVDVVAVNAKGVETIVKASLTETGPRTGIFQGVVPTTAPAAPDAPPATQPLAKNVLVFDVGQTVFARYLDEKNEIPGTPVVRESRHLGVSYHDGRLSLAKQIAVDGGGEGKDKVLLSACRVDLEAEPRIVLSDADLDITPHPDRAMITVFTESGSHRTLELTETGAATGVFAAALPLTDNEAVKTNPDFLLLRPGDLLWASYLDEHNIHPGHPTHRYAWFVENRPTAGEFLPPPLLACAWPYEPKPEPGEAPAARRLGARGNGKGRIAVSVRDEDALSDSSRAVSVKVNALVGGAICEMSLQPQGSGVAGRDLDLVLGEGNPAADDEPNTQGPLQFNVAGDDILRISYVDQKVATNDIQSRRVAEDPDAKEGDSGPKVRRAAVKPAGTEVIPLMRLRDPQRRVAADEAARLAELRVQMNVRLAGYMAERELFRIRRQQIAAAQPATAPATTAASAPTADAPKTGLTSIDEQISLLDQRIARLTALGAATQPAAEPPRKTAENKPDPALTAPIIAGSPFDIVIDDPDIRDETLPVRIRSLGGRLIQVLNAPAKRQDDGTYRLRVQTAAAETPSQGDTLSVAYGGDVLVDYQDKSQKPPAQENRFTYVAMASDAELAVFNANYTEEVTEIRLGAAIYVQVIDYDQDRSAALDQVAVVARSGTDSRIVICTETEPHSGIFRGKFTTDYGKRSGSADVLYADYASPIQITYFDHLRQTPASPVQKTLSIKVAGGTDGTVEAFGRQFRDAREEMRLWYTTGQSAYQIGRQLYLNGALARAEEHLGEAADYFTHLVAQFPEDPLAASSNYYLGNILSLKGNHREALARYQEIVSRWPRSEYVPKARFKSGECLEALGQFDQAADAYVLLTYHHPDDAHVPLAMIRMTNYYARNENWNDAVAIAQKFVEKFPQHEQAGAVAVKAGQWLSVAGDHDEALAWFTSAEKVFATRDKDMPAILFWHAATLMQHGKRTVMESRDAEKARELLNRVIYDYPRSEYVTQARSAMEQLTR